MGRPVTMREPGGEEQGSPTPQEDSDARGLPGQRRRDPSARGGERSGQSGAAHSSQTPRGRERRDLDLILCICCSGCGGEAGGEQGRRRESGPEPGCSLGDRTAPWRRSVEGKGPFGIPFSSRFDGLVVGV